MDGLRRVVTACLPARSSRPRRLPFVLLVAAVVIGSLALSGCVADPPPIIGTASPGDGQATVSWHTPLGAPFPITGYVVTPWVGSARQSPVVFNSTNTTQIVTGLTNGLTYTFSVHALNALGNDSAESRRSNLVTPQPAAGPEFPITNPVYGPFPSASYNAATAFDGTNYFSVWRDSRHGSEIWGTRVAPDGTVLDVGGIRIAAAAGSPGMVFDGINFLVMWNTNRGIFAVRVNTGGVVLDQTPIHVTSDFTLGSLVVHGNGSSLIVWQRCSPGQECDDTPQGPGIKDVVGARISSDGTVLDATPFAIATQMATTGGFDVAFDGTNYLVAWGNVTLCCPPQFPVHYGIVAQRVSGAGTLVGSPFLVADGYLGPESPNLSFDGTNFLAAWTFGLVHGIRVSPAGVLLDPSPFDISAAEASYVDVPAVEFDGTNTIVVWQDSTTGTLLMRRVDGAGAPVDPAPIPIVAGQFPVLTAGDGQMLLTFGNGSSATSIGATRIDGGTVLDNPPFALNTHANDQTSSAVAVNGTGSFVVWSDDRSGSSDIYGARVTADGSMLDGTGIPISTGTGNQTSAAVVFDGTDYFVAWTDNRSGTNDIYGARVTADGVVLDPDGIQITNTPSLAEFTPAIAFDGTNYFVVWEQTQQTICPCALLGARVSTTGTVLDPSGITLSTSGTPSNPTVAFGSGTYLVAWQFTSTVTTIPDVVAKRVGTDGTVLDPVRIAISNLSSSEASPQVAFNGTNFLIVWEDQRNGSATDIYGAHLSPAGTVLDPSGLAISTATDLQRQPHVAANAANGPNGDFFVVWRDDRTRGAAANASDIFGARVTDAGVVRDPAGVSITNINSDKSSPVVASGTTANTWDVPYTRFAAGTQYGAFRIFHRSVTLN